MATRPLLPMLALALALATAASARPDGKPDFTFTCSIGGKHAKVSTEGGRLVYRFGTAARTELTIAHEPKLSNVLYRYELYPRSNLQQLRFRNGPFSYALLNYWSAPGHDGTGYADDSWLMVLHGSRLISSRKCRDASEFTEDHRLDRLPEAPLLTPAEWDDAR